MLRWKCDQSFSHMFSHTNMWYMWPYFEPSISLNHSFHSSMPLVTPQPHFPLVVLYLCKQATNQKMWVMQNTEADRLCLVNCAGVGETQELISAALCHAHSSIPYLTTMIYLLNKLLWLTAWILGQLIFVLWECNVCALYCAIVCHTLFACFWSILQFPKSAHDLSENIYGFFTFWYINKISAVFSSKWVSLVSGLRDHIGWMPVFSVKLQRCDMTAWHVDRLVAWLECENWHSSTCLPWTNRDVCSRVQNSGGCWLVLEPAWTSFISHNYESRFAHSKKYLVLLSFY